MGRKPARYLGDDGEMHNSKKRSGANMGRSRQMREVWRKRAEESGDGRAAYIPDHDPPKPTDETEQCGVPGCEKKHYRRFIRGGD